MTYIYALEFQNKYAYIGMTNNPQRRFKEHTTKMKQEKHSAKILNNKQDDVEMIVLCECNDNSSVTFIAENCFNSIYQPKNGNILQQGLNKISLQRLEVDVAIEILYVLEKKQQLYLLNEIDLAKTVDTKRPKKGGFGKKSNI